MKIKYLVAMGAAAALGAGIASPAFAHAKLEISSPKAEALVDTSPKEVRLQFSEPLEIPFSKVKLQDEKGAVVEPTRLEIDKANPKAIIATVPSLHSGKYQVQWTTVTRDGHKIKGSYSFRVK